MRSEASRPAGSGAFTLLEVVAALALLGGLVVAASAAGGRLDRRAHLDARRVAALDALERLLVEAEAAAPAAPWTPGLRRPDLGQAVALSLREGSGGFEDDPGLRWSARLRPLGLAGRRPDAPPRPGDEAFTGLRALEVEVADRDSEARAAVVLVVGPPRPAPAPEATGGEGGGEGGDERG